MQRRAPSDINDYLQIVKRRVHWVWIPTLVFTMTMFMISVKLPKLYRSETFILVDPQKLPESVVKSTVTSDVTERLQTISQEILSRTHLEKIVDQYRLYRNEKSYTMEDKVEQMRKDISVQVIADAKGSRSGASGFKIGYLGPTPKVAQDVTRQISSLFIEENLKTREEQAQGTNEFIEAELQKAHTELLQQEARVKEFKSKHMGALPQQENSNLQLIQQYQQLASA